jgi:16S rRNA processing protein RimM
MQPGMERDDRNGADERPIVLAVIGGAHGIRGEVRVTSFTADPLGFAGYGPLSGPDGRVHRVRNLRRSGKSVIARFEGVDSREAAERLRGVELSVPRSALPADGLAEDEYYHADLIGLVACDIGGTQYGRVVAIHDFGGGDVLEIGGATGRSFMVPFSRAAVPVVDREGGRILLDPVAAGIEPPGETRADDL